MIILDATNKSLEVLLSGAVTTTQLPFVISTVDVLSVTQAVSALKENDGVTNDTSAVTMAAAPASGHTITVKSFTIYNEDTVAATVTVRVNNGGTFRKVCKMTLNPGDNLVYNDD